MKVCFATSECVPFVKTGGLADVSGALPAALVGEGCEVKVFLPLYGSIRVLDHDLTFAHEFHNTQMRVGWKTVTINVWYKRADSGEEYYFIDCPHYYHRGQIYTNDADEGERFILLQDAAFLIMQRYNWAPDVIHGNDWQTALMPVFVKEKYRWDGLFQRSASVLSIHNVGYQGRFGADMLDYAGLTRDKYHLGGPYEFYNSFSFLKSGLVYAEMITTVSPTYAQEIQTAAYGAGMENVLRSRAPDLVGILNGIDTQEWGPRTDRFISHHFDENNLAAKLKNKQELLSRTHLPFDENTPVFGMITRLTEQKGLELIASAFDEIMQWPIQLFVLGSGAQKYEDFLRWATQTYPEKVAIHTGFNNELAHGITAGCDLFLMPSRYEPCGLNQMYSLNYGTVPVVRRTGGLADTVHDDDEFHGEGNGFSFHDFTAHALLTSMQRALGRFPQREIWQDIMRRGMLADFSWKNSARQYLEVYERARSKRA
ncbi:MAG: glycogen synthase GlgA [bacterium]